MDCRGGLGLALCLLSAAAGCQHQVATLPEPNRSSPMPVQEPIDPSQIKKVSSLPRKDPPAIVVAKLGDFKAGEAFAPDVPPARQQFMRDEARREYQRALTIDPKCIPAYQGLARLYLTMQDNARAVETYQKALQIAPKNAAVWYELGMCHNYQKDWGPAMQCLDQAVRLDPENRDYLNTLGVVLARIGRYAESLDCFTRTSGEATGHYKLARTLQHLQQPELSRQHLELALQMDPNLATAQSMMSELNGPVSRSIQRTSYQETSAPLTPAAPVAPDTSAAPAPSMLPLSLTETNTTEAVNRSGQPAMVVPAPPAINLQYEAPPTEGAEPKP